jgi:hypothetical protein
MLERKVRRFNAGENLHKFAVRIIEPDDVSAGAAGS